MNDSITVLATTTFVAVDRCELDKNRTPRLSSNPKFLFDTGKGVLSKEKCACYP
jgi:hypothetical protein